MLSLLPSTTCSSKIRLSNDRIDDAVRGEKARRHPGVAGMYIHSPPDTGLANACRFVRLAGRGAALQGQTVSAVDGLRSFFQTRRA